MSSTLLMCKPDYFNVDYVINPWMNGHIHLVDKRLAEEQWQAFYETLRQYATIQLISPKPHLPDLVFTANGGWFTISSVSSLISGISNDKGKKFFSSNGLKSMAIRSSKCQNRFILKGQVMPSFNGMVSGCGWAIISVLN